MTLRLSEGCVIIKIPHYYGKPPSYSHNLYIIFRASGHLILRRVDNKFHHFNIGKWENSDISFCRVFLPARRQHGRPARRREHRHGLRRRDRHRHRVGQLVRRTLLQVCSSLRCPNVPLFITDFDANSVCTSAAPPAVHLLIRL